MWTRSCHRFTNEAAFLAACDAAGWPRDHQDRPSPPADVRLDIIGALSDPRWHVNAAWFCRDIDAAWVASEIAPATPSRVWA
jgi:hypothetical protein